MARDRLPVAQILELLEQAPARIEAAAAGLTAVQLRTPPAMGEWSVNDVLAHLRACADMWGKAIEEMLAADHPTLRAINPRSWIHQTDYPALEFAPSFAAYKAQRAALLAILRTLTPEQWARTATFTGAGKPIERTLHSFGNRIAIHERPHLKQIQRTALAVRF